MIDWFSRYFAGGDAPFFYSDQIQSITWYPVVWNDVHGLGESVIYRLWYDYPLQLTIKVLSLFGFDWWLIDKCIWLGIVGLCFYSAFKLSKYFFASSQLSIISAIIYSTNTYALMIFGGGQLGVFVGYSLLPLFFYYWIILTKSLLGSHFIVKYHCNKNLLILIKTSLITSSLIASDLRFGYVGMLLICMYLLGLIVYYNKQLFSSVILYNSIISFSIVGVLFLLIHSYWLVPAILTNNIVSSLGNEINSVGMVDFLSFADFSHTISLLHPNWPENLFGYVHFFQSGFLLIPLIAFSVLVFSSNRFILFFVVLSLVGSFLAKGTNEPFGGVYNFFFEHIPGFVMFRDPTKFYSLISLSYSVLIPASVVAILQKFRIDKKKYSKFVYIFSLLIIIFWGIVHKELFLGMLTGNFSPPKYSNEYKRYKDYMMNDQEFSRVLWIPEHDRFAYNSSLHPMVDANVLIDSFNENVLAEQATSSSFIEAVKSKGIRYIAVATDISQKVYLTEYRYDPTRREKYITILNEMQIPKISGFNELHLYDLGLPPPLISDSSGTGLSYIQHTSSHYSVNIKDKNISEVFFLMNYHPQWILKTKNREIEPVKTSLGFMSFPLPKNELLHSVELVFIPQYYAIWGATISFISMIVLLLVISIIQLKQHD